MIKLRNSLEAIPDQIEQFLSVSTHMRIIVLSNDEFNLSLNEQRYVLQPLNPSQRVIMFFTMIQNYLKMKGDLRQQLLDFAATSDGTKDLKDMPIDKIY